MVDTFDPKSPTRRDFARVFQDQRMVRAFERLFEVVPGDLITLQEEIEKLKFDVFVVDGDHTTNKNEVVVCTNTSPITVTLNVAPDEGERAIIKRRKALVNIIGDVDGEAGAVIDARLEALELVYTSSEGWSKV